MSFLQGNPQECFKKIFQLPCDNTPLVMFTDLKNLDDNFLIKYKKIFPWHFADSERSFLTDKLNNPKYEFSYYNRLHSYFSIDQIKHIIKEVKIKGSKSIGVTWNPSVDAIAPRGARIPCFILISAMNNLGNLDMSVTFRMRDIIRRVIPNWNAFKILQANIAKETNLNVGKFYDFSLRWFYRKDDFVKIKELIMI